jgi:hypothetical protein
MVPRNALGEQPSGLLTTGGDRGRKFKKTKETIKTKVEILADMSPEGHVNYV